MNLESLYRQEWRRVLGVNLDSAFFCIKAFLPGMKQRHRGNVITMSSAAARRPTAQSPMAYAAAKAGIELLTREIAAQAGSSGVRANCLAPETILTERNQRLIPEAIQEQLRLTHPIQRLGTPGAGGGIGRKMPRFSLAQARSISLSDQRTTGAAKAGQR